MPRVPVRLILNGKPQCGKSSLAQRLAENYNLEVIEVDELIKECMALAGRAEADPLRLTVTEVALNRDEYYG
jgi:broad-specificity NMP kinase